jgi:hypothetical protein
MRERLIAGIVLVVLGAYVLLQGVSFSSRRDVLKVGDVKLTATEERSVPPWVGGVALVAGLVLIVTGARRRAR